MKKILLCLLLAPVLSLGSEPTMQDFKETYFKQGVVAANTCHVYYQMADGIFNLKDQISEKEILSRLSDHSYHNFVNRIYKYEGDKVIFLDKYFQECINKTMKTGEQQMP